MTRNFCDFCGDDMQPGERSAVLTIGPFGHDEPRGILGGLFELPSAVQTRLEMCSRCLGHLLPITKRVVDATTAIRRRKNRAPIATFDVERLLRESAGKP